jgi:NAD+ synthase (glutamine-hydrolysing)
MLRFGFSPEKIYTLACRSFDQEYSSEVIKKWLVTFYRRFFSQQFKRNCLPDGVKVGSVGLGPRGDWKMPSDASVRLWLEEAERL